MSLKLVELLLMPLVLLLISISIQSDISERQEDLIVAQMVDSYFERVAHHLTISSENSSSVIIASTRALFMRLRQLERQNEIVNVLRFVSEVDPEILKGDVFEQDPQSDAYFVDLSGIQLSGISIDIIEAEGLRLSGATFDNSTFHHFSCTRCGFSGGTFKNVDFTQVSLVGSDFTGANFLGSNIDEVDLDGAIFDAAIWSDGRKCSEQSRGACK
jgi:uncharacterized protein YjbI with pentapeptide repeats